MKSLTLHLIFFIAICHSDDSTENEVIAPCVDCDEAANVIADEAEGSGFYVFLFILQRTAKIFGGVLMMLFFMVALTLAAGVGKQEALEMEANDENLKFVMDIECKTE